MSIITGMNTVSVVPPSGRYCSYTYAIDHDALEIKLADCCEPGYASLTNSMQEAVNFLAKLCCIDPSEYLMVYQDSYGVWDGWDTRNNNFVGLMCADGDVALDKFRELLMSRDLEMEGDTKPDVVYMDASAIQAAIDQVNREAHMPSDDRHWSVDLQTGEVKIITPDDDEPF